MLGFASCKKEDVKPVQFTTVEYVAKGVGLTVAFNEERFIYKQVNVNGDFSYIFRAEAIKEVFLSYSIDQNAPTQDILVQLKVNGHVINEFNQKHVAGVADVFGRFTVKIQNLEIRQPQ